MSKTWYTWVFIKRIRFAQIIFKLTLFHIVSNMLQLQSPAKRFELSQHILQKRELCKGAQCPPKKYCRQFNVDQEFCQCVERFYTKGSDCLEADAVCDVQLIVRIQNFTGFMTDSLSKEYFELEKNFTQAVNSLLINSFRGQFKESQMVSISSITSMEKVMMKLLFQADVLPLAQDVENTLIKYLKNVVKIPIETIELKPACDKLSIPPAVWSVEAVASDTTAKVDWSFKSTINIDQSNIELKELMPLTLYVVYVSGQNKVGIGPRKLAKFRTLQLLKVADPEAGSKSTVIIICGFVIATVLILAVIGFILLRKDETGEMIIKKIIRKRKRKKKEGVSGESSPDKTTADVKTLSPVDGASPLNPNADPGSTPAQPPGPGEYYYDDYYYNDYAYDTIPIPLDATFETDTYGAESNYSPYNYNEGEYTEINLNDPNAVPIIKSKEKAPSTEFENIPLTDNLGGTVEPAPRKL
ncbi:uncharacterized protein LOC135932007 isoform X2 [Gordionus sp. m RMFG-2023]|uniref:uncharacterized protein LOC135932007 isoform X2 n=1 Tax=Gordionus sp. m RMFG-2023 TaxID=3053472 RepID=UPI0031FD05A7